MWILCRFAYSGDTDLEQRGNRFMICDLPVLPTFTAGR